jgi:hypothetical protein
MRTVVLLYAFTLVVDATPVTGYVQIGSSTVYPWESHHKRLSSGQLQAEDGSFGVTLGGCAGGCWIQASGSVANGMAQALETIKFVDPDEANWTINNQPYSGKMFDLTLNVDSNPVALPELIDPGGEFVQRFVLDGGRFTLAPALLTLREFGPNPWTAGPTHNFLLEGSGTLALYVVYARNIYTNGMFQVLVSGARFTFDAAQPQSEAMVVHSPEPSTLGLLASAGLLLGGRFGFRTSGRRSRWFRSSL